MKRLVPGLGASRWSEEAARRTQQALARHRPGGLAMADTPSHEWPTKHELYVAARSHWAFALGERVAESLRAVAAFARELRARYRLRRRSAALRGTLRRLDGGRG